MVNFDDLEMMEPTLDLEMTWTYKPTCDGKVTLINNIGAPGNRVATKIFEGFGEALFKEFIMGRDLYKLSTTLGLGPVSIIHYTRPGSSIKRPTPN